MTAVVAVAAADAAILLAAGIVLAASQQVHTSAMALVASMLADVGALVPPSIANGLGTILAVFGAGWFSQVLGPAFAGSSGSAVPALGGVLAAPVYTVVRRRVRPTPPSKPHDSGPPPHRIFIPLAKTLDAERFVSTGLQES